MAFTIKGLHSHNFLSTSNEELIAVRGTKTWAYRSGSWLTGATLTNNKDAYMASFIDSVFLVNDTDGVWEYNGIYWTKLENALGAPTNAKFIFAHDTRLFLFGIKIDNGAPNVLSWPSRVMCSDYPNNGTVTWGLEFGSDLSTTAGSPVVTSPTAKFITNDIKIGDPFFINYSDAGNARNKPFIVQSIDSEAQLTLTEDITYTSTDDIYWVSGNWFDVEVDQGDSANGIGLASNELITFLKNAVYRYNATEETKRQIKDVPGTTSPRSVVSWGNYCYWYHPSGIYRTGGGTGEKISNGIEDIIEGVTDANQTQVVGWVNQIENTVNMYLGDVTLRDGETIGDCVATLDLNLDVWAPKSYDRQFTVAANWLHSSVPEVYAGDTDSGVFQLDTGTNFNGSVVPFGTELYPIFPAGEDAIVTFDRLRAYVFNGPDIQILYRLVYKPRFGKPGVWDTEDDWKGLKGTQIGERTEWKFPFNSRASGVQLKVIESGADETFLIEKFTLYYSDVSNF